MTNSLQDEAGIVEIASEWKRLLLAYGEALKSTPHLYISALSWLPDIVRSSFPSELRWLRTYQMRGSTKGG